MATPGIPTQEIGSLAKPNWRVKAAAGKPITPADIAECERWAKITGTDARPLVALLNKPKLTDAEKDAVAEWSSLFGIRYLESAGLDIVYDGEQRRTEMYEHAARSTKGLRFLGHVRSFDNKYYLKAAIVERPTLLSPFHNDEFEYVKAKAKGIVKVPITGAFTIADWSYNEYYLKRAGATGTTSATARYAAKREFAVDIARNVIRPNIEALVKAGATRIQIDEPAVATKPEEVPIFVESFNESTKGIAGCRFSLHLCFSDYKALYPAILDLKDCSEYAMEFGNRDSWKAGTTKDVRWGYEFIELMKQHGDKADIGLGVLDVHRDDVEKPELVRDRIIYAAKLLGKERVLANPDCGLRTRSWDVAHAKLRSLAEGAAQARKEL
ncbi:MAG: hypothetical protein HY556_02605 [Euryarchaeota archaeon]|nr:hypothetical protein [Euryarchaeota archaeon]